MGKKILVAKPFLPPLAELLPLLEEIWESRNLTNQGPFHQQLEKELALYIGGGRYVSLFSNATIALLVAIKALGITGDVITTPYTFVATAHALLWNGLNPIFVDIDRANCNIDPAQIEAAITPRTSAILPVHCYGLPCEVEKIQRIADDAGLKVIYDAAHAFGVDYREKSLLQYGDISVVSFHATKIFNTFEGGAIISKTMETKQRVDYLKNFGFVDEVTVVEPGLNGKLSEFNSALGLVQLSHMSNILTKRAHIDAVYRNLLKDLPGVTFLEPPRKARANFSYLPIFIQQEYPLSRDALYKKLKSHGIFARRYFYPLITSFPMYQQFETPNLCKLPNAHAAASQVLCLPIYPDLREEEVQQICRVIINP